MIDYVKNFFLKRTVRSTVRGAFKFLSGFLVAYGANSAQVEAFTEAGVEIAIGVALFALTQAKSNLEKRAYDELENRISRD